MAGFLGGSSGSGTGGEIQFPAEFIDPVTKLRVSEPETLIDTDFEYGLQPTKWETVELINNTPSFFSKSGDTTIGNITSMVTTAISREIKVTTSENHGLAVGIPINVSGTKSITADGSYIINSIPDPKSFTYLAKQNQDTTASIFDLYTSIITGEFFQGSQIKISDSQGIVTNAGSPSALTVQTDSPHGFQVGTPFYFLNLNSTVSQQFDASNTGAKTFDSSNSATAQTFDGSNTLTSYVVDFNNKAITSGTTSATQTFSSANKTITVLHTSENFASKPVGTPLYYNVIAASGYFNTYPRGIVYLADNTFNALGSSTSTFSVASVPGGTVLDIPTYPSGTFQLATNAVLFAGNNNDSVGQLTVPVSQSGAQIFDGANSTGSLSTVNTYSGTIIQNNNDAGSTISSGLGLKSMVLYTTTGTAASGLTNNTTYWVTYYNEPAGASVPGFYQIKVAATPGGADISISGGTGTQKFRQIGVSVDKDIFYIPLHGLANGDMVKYSYPAGGAITMASLTSDYAYVGTVYDTHNFSLDLTPGLAATGGDTSAVTFGSYKVHTFLNSGTFTVTSGQGNVEALIVGGGGTGGARHGGGGGAGGMLEVTNIPVSAGAYPIVIGNGGPTFTTNTPAPGASANGSSTTAFGNTAYGGGGGGTYSDAGSTTPNAGTWGSAGGMGYGNDAIVQPSRGVIAVGTGTAYGTATSARVQGGVTGTGGGGAGNNSNAHAGGSGRQNNIDGNNYYYAGGGGGSSWGNSGGTNFDMRGGIGGGGGGGSAAENWDTNLLVGGGSARNAGGNGITGTGGGAGGAGTGGTGGANTGGGGGGSGQNGGFPNYNGYGGGGGKGIVIVRYIG